MDDIRYSADDRVGGEDAHDRCAGTCGHEEDVRMMSQCLVLDIDSAAVSRLATAIARGGARRTLPRCEDVPALRD